MNEHSRGHHLFRTAIGTALLGVALGAWACDRMSGGPGSPAAPTGTPVSAPAPPTVTGVVFGDGTPLADASVDVHDLYVREHTKTDASGRYRVSFRGFSSPVWVRASHDRFQYQPCAAWYEQRASDPADETVDVRLSSAEALSSAVSGHTAGRRHVSGTIYESTATGRQPASDALVMWDLSADDYKAWTQADAAGRFTLCGLPVNGRGSVFAAKGNQWAWSLVEAGGDVAIEVTLETIE